MNYLSAVGYWEELSGFWSWFSGNRRNDGTLSGRLPLLPLPPSHILPTVFVST